MARPVLYVLAGVNGAGKSSVGGHLLEEAGLTWFNPDAFAREWATLSGCRMDEANIVAWQEGLRRLDDAIAKRRNHAFETTLGGRTLPARIRAATETHDVLMWFCGLATPDLHIARVQARVAAGGHDIPELKIRERFPAALKNLIALMLHLKHLRIYDNSAEAAPNDAVPDPILIAKMDAGALVWPTDIETLQRTPTWAKPLLEAALDS